MRSNPRFQKFMLEPGGENFEVQANHSPLRKLSKNSLAKQATSDPSDTSLAETGEAEDILYAHPIPAAPHRRLSPKSVNNKLKVAHLAEERLIQISDQLLKLAEEIRYINPLMAEALDEAWESTEEAIEMLSRDDVWSDNPFSSP